MKLKLFTLCAMLLFGSSAFAQSDKAKIEHLIRGYAKAYENVTKRNTLEEILKFVSTDLKSTNVQTYVNGRTNIRTASYDGFVDYLNMIRETEELEINYDIKEIEFVTVNGNVASAVYSVDYGINRSGSKWSSGHEIVTMSFKRADEESDWKIIFFNFVGIENEKLKGACLCELFVASTGNYVAKTTVPTGKSYTTDLNNFEFKKENDTQLIKHNGIVFEWNNEGEILIYGKSTTTDIAQEVGVIGVADNADDAVLAIVENFLYDENCTDFKVRKTGMKRKGGR